MSRFRGMALEEALLSLISMTSSSSMVGADQLRELNSNLNDVFKAQKVVENSQYVTLAEKKAAP